MAEEQRHPFYPDPPHIQVGFYWHDHPEPAQFDLLAAWFLRNGYRLSPTVDALKREYSDRISERAFIGEGLGEQAFHRFTDWTSVRPPGHEDWIPVNMDFFPVDNNRPCATLGYARINEDGLNQNDRRAIEILVSGAFGWSVSARSPETVQEARMVNSWVRSTLTRISDELDPDYAGEFFEWELQPPHAFLTDVEFPLTLVVSRRVCSPEVLLADLKGWSIDVLSHGTMVDVFQAAQGIEETARVDFVRSGATLIREKLRQYYHL